MGLKNEDIVIVTDIGCSGLFDTFFNTHAMHGLHGRALTYAAGIKLARPDLCVIVTMGDGCLGIGGAHFLSACRRNMDITLLLLNNFNFGMTGGQFSATTPADAAVDSGFLNTLEAPMDACKVAFSAGATYTRRCSSYDKRLPGEIENAIHFNGFSMLDIWGVCPGRYTKRNKLTPSIIDENIANLPPIEKTDAAPRKEYIQHYKEAAIKQKIIDFPAAIDAVHDPIEMEKRNIMILGSAGQRIITAGELLCYAGISAGLTVTQKNEYNITVLKGPSISEIIVSPEEIDFTGIDKPDIVIALDPEGVERRKHVFEKMTPQDLVIRASHVDIPLCRATIHTVDFKKKGLKSQDFALGALAVLAKCNRVIHSGMLHHALKIKFSEPVLSKALEIVKQIDSNS